MLTPSPSLLIGSRLTAFIDRCSAHNGGGSDFFSFFLLRVHVRTGSLSSRAYYFVYV